MPIPEIVDVIDISTAPGRFKRPGSYTQDAKTSCGHNYVCWWKFYADGTTGIEHHGVTLRCGRCSLIQVLGPANDLNAMRDAR